MARLFNEGMDAKVEDNGELSEPFPVTNGVKQGCVLDPTLFSMLFSAMLMLSGMKMLVLSSVQELMMASTNHKD